MTVRIAVVHAPRENDYVRAVQLAGAEPVVIDWSGGLRAGALDELGGVLLTGGADVDPMMYGEAPHPAYEPADRGRDAFETELIRQTLERDQPLLAICRGAQILNVVCGGTLWQDIPSQVGTRLAHQVARPRDALAHTIEITGDSRLHRILGPGAGGVDARSLGVNSRHHQAVRHLAPGFVVSARAPDGVIEAIERPSSRFCLGVQWHPENFWRTGEFARLFEAFLEAAAAQAR